MQNNIIDKTIEQELIVETQAESQNYITFKDLEQVKSCPHEYRTLAASRKDSLFLSLN